MKKIRTSRLGRKKGVLIKKKSVTLTGYFWFFDGWLRKKTIRSCSLCSRASTSFQFFRTLPLESELESKAIYLSLSLNFTSLLSMLPPGDREFAAAAAVAVDAAAAAAVGGC